MGLKDFLRKNSKNKYQNVIQELINDLSPILNEYDFRFNNIETLSKNEYTDVTWTMEESDKYFQFNLHKLSEYYRRHESIADTTPDYELTMVIGEGGYDFSEKKWSAIPIHLLTKGTKEIYTFKGLEELTVQLNDIKNSLKNTLTIFSQDFNIFLETRKKANLEKFVNQTVAFNKSTGWGKIEIEQNDQIFKEKYTK